MKNYINGLDILAENPHEILIPHEDVPCPNYGHELCQRKDYDRESTASGLTCSE
jgi:hypothetical protein